MGLCMVKHLQWTLAGMCPSRTLMWSDQGLLSISKSRLKTKDDTKDETSHTKHTNETVLDTHLGGFNIFLYMVLYK